MFMIRSATVADVKALGQVHYVSWQETYQGLIDPTYLQTRSAAKSEEMFRQEECKNTLVAEIDGTVVGFAKYGPSRDEDSSDVGEIYALYLLKEHHRKGYGRRLLEFVIRIMPDYQKFSLWVLESNQKAIQFYQSLGFSSDGKTKMQRAGDTYLREVRMTKTIEPLVKRRRSF